MGRDFEQAYKELAQSEIPDLWDRIEAGLSEKSTPESTPGNTSEKKEISFSEKRKRINFGRYAGMAAAVLCVVLIIPAAISLSRSGQKGYSEGISEDRADAGAAAGAAEGSGGWEAEAAEAESYVEAEAAAQETDYGETTAEAADYEEGAAASADKIENLSGTIGTESGTADTNGMEDAASMDRSEALADKEEMKSAADRESGTSEAQASGKQNDKMALEEGAVIEKVRVRVIEQATVESYDIDEAGIIYTVTVYKDESGCFEEGEQVEIFVPVYSSTRLIENKVFEVNLVYRSDETYSFVLEGIARQIEE